MFADRLRVIFHFTIGLQREATLVEETWDEEESARRPKLAALHPKCLPPEERAFWLGILGDPDNFVGSDVPDEIEIDDAEPTPVEELLFGRPALKLPPIKRELVRGKWENFLAAGARPRDRLNR